MTSGLARSGAYSIKEGPLGVLMRLRSLRCFRSPSIASSNGRNEALGRVSTAKLANANGNGQRVTSIRVVLRTKDAASGLEKNLGRDYG